MQSTRHKDGGLKKKTLISIALQLQWTTLKKEHCSDKAIKLIFYFISFYSVVPNIKEETMALAELVPKYRDKVLSQDGGILASAGDKIFIRLLLDTKQVVRWSLTTTFTSG